MKRYVAVAALAAALGAGAAQAQVLEQYDQIKSCQDTSLSYPDRVKACDADLAKLPADAENYGHIRAIGLFYRSDAKSLSGDYDGAIADADEARKLYPDSRFIMAAQCWARGVANRQLKTAKQNCDDSLEINPDDPNVMDSAGMVALRQGRWADAAAHYSKAYSYDKSMVNSLFGVALAAYAQGKTESGDTIADTVKSRKPEVIEDFKRWGFTVEGMKAKAKAKAAPAKPASKPAMPKPN